jgi:hypothetical protein
MSPTRVEASAQKPAAFGVEGGVDAFEDALIVHSFFEPTFLQTSDFPATLVVAPIVLQVAPAATFALAGEALKPSDKMATKTIPNSFCIPEP